MTDAADAAAEELYGLPPGEFTSARNERAKELRKAGDRASADEVRALRRPTVAAWALNQLARRRSGELERLLAAGEQLRAAQEELLAGGDRAAFQEAAAAERDLAAELARDAEALVSETGEKPGAGLREKIAETLHAAALDEETAEELRTGRLLREREAIGGFGGLGAAALAGAAPSRQRNKQAARRSRGDPTPPRRQPKAASDDARRRERLSAARTDERQARRELEAVAKALRSAETRAEAAEAHAADGVERAKTAAERLKEARRKETAARKAHARAERALKSAEG